MQVSRRFLLPLVVLFSVGSCALAAEKTTLRLRLKAGESYTIAMTADQKITQTVGGAVQNIAQTIGTTYTFKTAAVDPDGTIHGTFTYDAVRCKMDGPGMVIDYDSSKVAPGAAAPVNPMAKTFAALVGQTLDVVMTPEGRVTELKGADRIMAAVIKAMALPEAARAAVEQQLKTQFGDEALKKTFEQITAIYPKDPVELGDTWDAEQHISMGFPMILKTTWTLKSLTGGKATIGAEGTIETGPPAAGAAAPAPGTPTLKLKGTQKGTLLLDQATGWLTSGNIAQAIEGSISVNAGGQELVIPMTIKSDTKFEQVKPKK